MKNKEFVDRLKLIPDFTGDKERQVEAVYNEMLRTAFPGIVISNPYKCDGYFETVINNQKTRIICEYKYDLDMQNKTVRSQVIAQVLFYLKKFEADGKAFPNVILIGDVNECFVIHSNEVLQFLDFEQVDWDAAASSAGAQADLVMALASDEKRNAYVFSISDGFDFNDIISKITDYATNVTRLIRITEHNVDKVFSVFEKIVRDKKLNANDMASCFFGAVTDKENYYLHPSKKNCLVTPRGEVRVLGDQFIAFMKHFASDYSPREKARLAAISDRLIEDTTRRRKGEFYTPTQFVDYAHKMISAQLGEDWREKYVVIDCACGTKNLTRDYHFKELYCSTLEQAELDISKAYSPEATSFQFDFLNDPLENLPQGLLKAFEEKKPIVWLINPPYGSGTGSSAGSVKTASKGTAKNLINVKMLENSIGEWAASNLYTQFIYRIIDIQKKYELTDMHLNVFCPPGFIVGQRFKKFRDFVFDNLQYVDGIQFDSRHFADVAFGAICFTQWKVGTMSDRSGIMVDTIDDSDDGLISLGKKFIYNLDDKVPANVWFKTGTPKSKKVECVACSSALNPREDLDAKCLPEALGDFGYVANNVFHCGQNTALVSMAFSGSNHISVVPENFERVAAYFSARLLCDKDAYNQFDEFMAPNESDPRYRDFVNDAMVYSLFHGKSQQSSLRNISYHGKVWNISNNFFWLSKDQIKNWADEANLDFTYNDATASDERFLFKKLQSIKLSTEAQEVLDKASELVHASMKYRALLDSEMPECQILNWDAGWYQVKKLLKKYMPEELKAFKAVQKKLEEKMRPMVYELGFLKK